MDCGSLYAVNGARLCKSHVAPDALGQDKFTKLPSVCTRTFLEFIMRWPLWCTCFVNRVSVLKNRENLAWQYTLRYSAAMLLVAGLIILGALQINGALQVNKVKAQIINTASEQRALAQQLVLLPDRVAAETNSYTKDRALQNMETAIQKMRAGHKYLMQGRDDLPPPAYGNEALRTLYSPEGERLDERVKSFLDFYQEYLNNPDINQNFVVLQRTNAENFLYFSLERAANLHTERAEETMQQAIELHRMWVLLSLAFIVFVCFSIFRPLARDAAKAVAKVGARLDERTKLLSRSLSIAKMGHWRSIEPVADKVWFSQELIELLGMELTEGFHWFSKFETRIQFPGDVSHEHNPLNSAYARVWKTGSPEFVNLMFRKLDDTVIDILLLMEAEQNSTGKVVGIVGVVKDETDKVAAAKALKKSYDIVQLKSRDLVEAQRLGNLATWRNPLNSNLVQLDDRAFEILHLDPQEFDPTVENINRLYLDGDREYAARLNQKVVETGQHQSVTVQARRGDGKVIDLNIRSKLERDEIGAVCAVFGTIQDVTKERETARELERLAYYDNLTGLANRALFTRHLNRVCKAASQSKLSTALFLIDLDHFKEVNDTLGHEAGDQLLGIVGQRLSKSLSDKALIARLGGDEFAILLENFSSRAELEECANSIIHQVSKLANLSHGVVQTNASIGISMAPSDSSNPNELLRFADLALYASKEQGRGRYSYYEESLSTALGARISMGTEIRTALDEHRFEAHYQMIVDAQSETVNGFEALLRLPKKGGGFIPPSEFIPVAESSHLIADLGEFVLQEACREAQYWSQKGQTDRTVSVNVSAAQFWHGHLEQVVDRALSTSKLNPKLLCIELTESVFAADNIDRVGGILRRLKNRGILLALDDFGTGYSSLAYLNRLPFDKLKIDRMFVTHAHANAEKKNMLRGIVSLAKGLNLNVTAEGVETEEEYKMVRDLGCDDVQGWLFGVALPAQEAIEEADIIDTKQNTEQLRWQKY